MENIVYTIPYCPYCVMAKQLLERAGVAYEERLLKTPDEIDEIKNMYNWRTMPVIILNGRFVGGFDEADALVRGGKLEEVLDKK